MNDQIQAIMAEATRLTCAGRLAEATALIQRTLGGMSAAAGSSGHADAPIEAEVRIMEDPTPLREPTRQGSNRVAPGPASAQRVVVPQAPSAYPLRLPGGLHYPTWPGPQVRPGRVSPSSQPGGRFVDGAYSNAAGMRPYKLYIPNNSTGQTVLQKPREGSD